MTNFSDSKNSAPPTKRRTILLALAGAWAALVPRSAWPSGNAKASTTPPPTHPDLKRFGPDRQVRRISHRNGTFRVTTCNGRVMEFRESVLRFKIDSTDLGPRPGSPVMLPAGSMGDLAWVFFATPGEIGGFIDNRA